MAPSMTPTEQRTIRNLNSLVKPVLVICVLAAFTNTESANAFARTGAEKQDRATQTAQCGYLKNRAWFDTCTCGAFADEMAAIVQASASPVVILIDGYANTNEPVGIERTRAENAWLYLVNEKGVDRGRIVLRWSRQGLPAVGKYVGGLRITLLRAGDALPSLGDVSSSQLPST